MTHDVVKIGTETVALASILHTVLPPWEAFNDFPTAQKYYKLLIYFVGYIALNGRSTVWQSVSTKNGTQPSQAVTSTNGNNPQQGGNQ